MKRIATAIALTAGACAAPAPPAPVVTTTAPTTTTTTTTTVAPTTSTTHTHPPRAARRRAASVAPSEGMPGQDVTLASIRACESGGNYGAVSRSGRYRGAYQFDQRTWEGVGGSGDPAAASAEEQDARAARLYAERGSQPWPTCG